MLVLNKLAKVNFVKLRTKIQYIQPYYYPKYKKYKLQIPNYIMICVQV